MDIEKILLKLLKIVYLYQYSKVNLDYNFDASKVHIVFFFNCTIPNLCQMSRKNLAEQNLGSHPSRTLNVGV